MLEGSRKFVAMFLLILVGAGLRLGNLVNGAELIDLLKTCAVAFFSANISEHVINGAKEFFEAKKGE